MATFKTYEDFQQEQTNTETKKVTSLMTSLGNDWLRGPQFGHSSDLNTWSSYATDKDTDRSIIDGNPVVASTNSSIICPQPIRPSTGLNLSHGILPPIYENPELAFDGVSTHSTQVFKPPLPGQYPDSIAQKSKGPVTYSYPTSSHGTLSPIYVKPELALGGVPTHSSQVAMPPLPREYPDSVAQQSQEPATYSYPPISSLLPTEPYLVRPRPNYNRMPSMAYPYPGRVVPSSGMVGFPYMVQHRIAATGKGTKSTLFIPKPIKGDVHILGVICPEVGNVF